MHRGHSSKAGPEPPLRGAATELRTSSQPHAQSAGNEKLWPECRFTEQRYSQRISANRNAGPRAVCFSIIRARVPTEFAPRQKRALPAGKTHPIGRGVGSLLVEQGRVISRECRRGVGRVKPERPGWPGLKERSQLGAPNQQACWRAGIAHLAGLPRNCELFKYSARSTISDREKRGHAICLAFMLSSMAGPCSHRMETIEKARSGSLRAARAFRRSGAPEAGSL